MSRNSRISRMGSTRMTPEEARAKAAECRAMAEATNRQEHRVMLTHMAETWERIAKDLKPRTAMANRSWCLTETCQI